MENEIIKRINTEKLSIIMSAEDMHTLSEVSANTRELLMDLEEMMKVNAVLGMDNLIVNLKISVGTADSIEKILSLYGYKVHQIYDNKTKETQFHIEW